MPKKRNKNLIKMEQSIEWGPIVNFLKEFNKDIDPLVTLAYIVAACLIIFIIYRWFKRRGES